MFEFLAPVVDFFVGAPVSVDEATAAMKMAYKAEPTTIIAGLGLALSAFGQIKARKEAKAQAKAAQKAEQAETRRANLRQARERRRVAAETRAEQAEITQASGNLGATTSSAARGGAGGVGTRGTAEVGFLNASSSLAKGASIFRQKAAGHMSKAAGYQAIGALGGTIFANSASLGAAAGSVFSRFSKSAGASSAGAAPSGVTLSSGGFRGDTPFS